MVMRLKIAGILLFLYISQIQVLDLLALERPRYPTYYFLCGFYDFLAYFCLGFLGKNKLIYDLQDINELSVAAHCLGYVIWYSYLPPDVYNVILYTLLAWQIVRLLSVTDDDLHTKFTRRSGLLHSPAIGIKKGQEASQIP